MLIFLRLYGDNLWGSGARPSEERMALLAGFPFGLANFTYGCLQCGFSNQDKARVRRHAEVHFPGFVHECHYCGVTKKSSTALRMHIHSYHNIAKGPNK